MNLYDTTSRILTFLVTLSSRISKAFHEVLELN